MLAIEHGVSRWDNEMMKIVAWNIARREECWRALLGTDADLALLQEATPPPPDIAERFDIDPSPWRTAGNGLNRPWRTAVVKLSDRVGVQWLEPKSIEDAAPGELAVSRLGTLTAAAVTPDNGEPLTVVSVYGAWERPHFTTGSGWIDADGSVHRAISDFSSLVGRETGHRILVAGDFNILRGYGERGSKYWAKRYASVFSRMGALGFAFVGPTSPNGRQADPWPDELPRNSENVPTYHTNLQTPTTATRQLDYAFASNGFADGISVTALNKPEQWGPSDHCRIEIVVT
jgi:endonuclease/exonuclease/phosphatase family metal-dependent hydrolase